MAEYQAQTPGAERRSEDTVPKSEGPERAIKIAVTGKGGSGKTMLTAIMTGLLARNEGLRVLAIDADSAVNLCHALGVTEYRTVAEIRRQIIEDPGARAQMQQEHIRDVMAAALVPGQGFHLLVMGRPEGPGCYCSVNDLLRYGIERLSHDFDVTLVDCEAGPEQVNRRVVQGVDVLLIITDTSVRGAQAAGSIVEVVQRDEALRPARTGLIVNRTRGDDELMTRNASKWGIEVLGRIPEDDNVREYDSVGKPMVSLPDGSPSVKAIREILRRVVPFQP